jgi:hypothetical protein
MKQKELTQVLILLKININFKKIMFFCSELKFLFSFALMKKGNLYNWWWRSSYNDAVNHAVI